MLPASQRGSSRLAANLGILIPVPCNFPPPAPALLLFKHRQAELPNPQQPGAPSSAQLLRIPAWLVGMGPPCAPGDPHHGAGLACGQPDCLMPPPGRGAGAYFHSWSIYNICSYKQGNKNNSSVPLSCPAMLRVAQGFERLKFFRAWSEKPDYGKTISGCADLLQPLTTAWPLPSSLWAPPSPGAVGWTGTVGGIGSTELSLAAASLSPLLGCCDGDTYTSAHPCALCRWPSCC